MKYLKKILPPILAFFMHLYCCGTQQKDANRVVYNNVKSDSSSVSHLLGTWIISERVYLETRNISKNKKISNLISVKCNECPEISFFLDRTGSIKYSDDTKAFFTWRLINKKLYFVNAKNKSKTNNSFLIDDGIYLVAVVPQALGESVIELISHNNSKKILRKI